MASYNSDDIQCSSSQHQRREQVNYVNLHTLNKANETNIVYEEYPNSALLNEIHSLKLELKKRDEATQKLISSLTEEVIGLRKEVRKLNSQSLNEVDSILLPQLPLFSLLQLREFDTKIAEEDAMQTQLKHIIQRIGGNDMPSFMKMAIKTIISDELAIELTWRGTSDKPSIQQFKAFNIIKDICLLKFRTASVFDVNRVCQQHFLHAKDRVNKRQRKF